MLWLKMGIQLSLTKIDLSIPWFVIQLKSPLLVFGSFDKGQRESIQSLIVELI